MIKSPVKIDLNRGVTMKTDLESGIKVCMYKDDPGNFFDLNGGVLPPSFAKKAHFDIKALEKKKKYNKAIGDARESLDHEYSGVAEQEVLIESGPFKAIATAYGHADIFRDGEKMNTVAIKAKEAIELVEQLAKQPEETVEEVTE